MPTPRTLRAWNVGDSGVATSEFSWFPGYSWRYALCGGCGVQLGWTYRGEASPDVFWGLLSRELTEIEEQRDGS